MSNLSLKQVNLANLTNTAMSTLTCDDNGKVLMDGEEVVDLSEFGSSLTGNGWQKLPSGLIIQWGQDTSGVHPMPITFPNVFLKAYATDLLNPDSTGLDGYAGAAPSTLSSIAVRHSVGSASAVSWLAIGY